MPCYATCAVTALPACAAENMHLSEQVAALREEAAADEAEALRDDVVLLRAEVIRLSEDNKRLLSAPRVSSYLYHQLPAHYLILECCDARCAIMRHCCIARKLYIFYRFVQQLLQIP